MAVEMAKLSMWLTTVAKNRPFTFLDHALKAGDSLLGIWDPRPTPTPPLRRRQPAGHGTRRSPVSSAGGDAATGRRAAHTTKHSEIAPARCTASRQSAPPTSNAKHEAPPLRARTRLAILATIADVLAGAALEHAAGERDPSHGAHQPSDGRRRRSHRRNSSTALDTPDADSESCDRARRPCPTCASTPGDRTALPSRNPLHWPVAFPEVFARGSSRRIRRNGGQPAVHRRQKITGAAGTDYRNHLIAWTAGGTKGSADLVAYFFLNAAKTARSLGFLATNTIAQGDTSEVGLTQIIDAGWKIHRAVSSTTWPGDATLEIAKVWATAHPMGWTVPPRRKARRRHRRDALPALAVGMAQAGALPRTPTSHFRVRSCSAWVSP